MENFSQMRGGSFKTSFHSWTDLAMQYMNRLGIEDAEMLLFLLLLRGRGETLQPSPNLPISAYERM